MTDAITRDAAAIPGQRDIDQGLELTVADPARAPALVLAGELVAPLEPLVDAWAATLIDAPQTQRTYRQAGRRFLSRLGPDAGPEALTLHTMAAYQAHLAARARPDRPSAGRARRQRPPAAGPHE